MTEKEARAERLKNLMLQPGWADVILLKIDKTGEYEDELLHMMDSKQDALTGKKAVSLASKRKALNDFFGDLDDDVTSNQPQPARAGTK